MAFVARCVKVWESEAKIKESVLLPTAWETTKYITNSILNELHAND